MPSKLFFLSNELHVSISPSLERKVQISSDTTTQESPENTTNVNAANEKIFLTKDVADDQPKQQACIAEQTIPFIGKSELPASLPDTVGSDKGDNHQSNAKKAGKQSKKKYKIVGILESYQGEKEKTSEEEKGK